MMDQTTKMMGPKQLGHQLPYSNSDNIKTLSKPFLVLKEHNSCLTAKQILYCFTLPLTLWVTCSSIAKKVPCLKTQKRPF